MIKLTITEKGGEPRALSFDQSEVSIGRVQGNDIVLPKGNISKRHSKLSLIDGRIVVVDAKSTNGTYVNGRKIGEATPVRPGDKIFVGDFLIVIDPHAAPTAEASSTGSRRHPPPPPPPPPRPGSGLRPVPSMASEYGDDSAVGDSGARDRLGAGDSDVGLAGGVSGSGLGSGRLRPPAPPPPPPRRTLNTAALQDDSVDIGSDEPPPSPDDIGEGAIGDVRSADGGDVDGGGLAGLHGDAGSDVFGSRPAPDEDAVGAGEFPGSAAESPTRSGRPGLPAGDLEALGGVLTPPPLSPARASALLDGGTGDTHSPSGTGLEALLTDPTVSAIVITPGGSMQVTRAGRTEAVAATGDGNAMAETVWQIANTAVPPPPSDNPVVDVRLIDGTRITALFPPITVGSVSAVIRKSATPDLPLSDLSGGGDAETLLRAAVTSRRNLLLAGDGPAVAALLAALGDAVPSERRVVSVGAGMKGRAGWIELGQGMDPAALVRATAAFQADHLLLADAGGAEWPEVLLAAARGQEGVVACMAGRSAAEALMRLRAFTAGALGITGLATLVASTIDLVIVVGSQPHGGARILEIAEPEARGEELAAIGVARRSDGGRGATALEVSGVSARLAATIASVADGLPGHLVRA